MMMIHDDDDDDGDDDDDDDDDEMHSPEDSTRFPAQSVSRSQCHTSITRYTDCAQYDHTTTHRTYTNDTKY